MINATRDDPDCFCRCIVRDLHSRIGAAPTGAGDPTDQISVVVPPIFTSNTSQQIYFSQTNTAATRSNSLVNTLGWVDRRGRDA